MMKHFLNQSNRLLLLYFLTTFYMATAQKNNLSYTNVDVASVLTKAMQHDQLWEGVPLEQTDLTAYNILHHGVELSLPYGFTINEIPLRIIEKNEIPLIGDQPYFIIHTFNIDGDKAMVRIYLTYTSNGDVHTSQAALSFAKTSGNWTIEISTL